MREPPNDVARENAESFYARFRKNATPERPCDGDVLRSYARASGISRALEKRAIDALRVRNPKLFSGMVNPQVEGAKLVDILTQDLWVDPRTRIPHAKLLEFRRAIWSYLDDELAQSKIAVDQERELLSCALPADPTLRAIVEQLRAVHTDLRSRLDPIRQDKLIGARTSLIDQSPPLLRTEDQSNILRPPVTVELTLAVQRNNQPLFRCTCPARAGCEHALAITDLAIMLLTSRGDEPFARQVKDALSSPDWKRALQSIDQFRAGTAERTEARLWWLIEREHDELNIRPLIQETGKRGLLKPKRIAPQRLREEHLDELSAIDRELVELLDVADDAARYHRDSAPFLARAFRKLVGHPRVLAESDAPPIAVEEGAIELIARADNGRITLQPAINGTAMSAREFIGRFIMNGVADVLVELEPETRRCIIVPLSQKLLSLLSTLERFDIQIPVEERDALITRLPLLEAHAPVRFEGELHRVEVEGAKQIVVRLEPGLGGGALGVQIFVRPIAFGPLLVPGTGAAEVVAATDSRNLVFARRDLEEEPRWVTERLAPLIPGLDGVGRSWALVIDDRERALDMIDQLRRAEDVIVEWHGDAWRVTAAASQRDMRLQVEDRGDWFGLSGGIDVAGQRITIAVLLDAIRGKQRYVQVEAGTWSQIDDTLRAELKDLEPLLYSGRSGVEVTALAIPQLEELRAQIADLKTSTGWRDRAQRIADAETFEPALPSELRAELRPYQLDGFKWLSRLAQIGAGACLADDMGLGKTLQTIAVLLDRHPGGPALVVAPTSVAHNWLRELERFAPKLRVRLYRGSSRQALLNYLGPGDVLIASYGLLVRDLEKLKSIVFHTLVLDEAQAVKNAASHRARAVRDLSAHWRVALTGTPIENHLGELWAIFRAVAPELLGSWDQFRERFATPIERDRDPAVSKVLARSLRPFVLRRTKREVAKELPPRTEIEVDVELSPKEREIYEDARLAAVAKLTDLENSIEVEQRRFHVLAAITRLRQLACHPHLVDENLPVGSAKLERLLELVRALIEEGQRALIFSQFTKHLALVRKALDHENINYQYLDGSTPAESREKIVDNFQKGTAPLFLISLKAGGTGLNLTAADNVIHLDPWWNPAVEDQATDRAHRIGQTRPVTVYRMVSRGTIEDAILKLHGDKRALVADVLDGSGAAAAITTAELMAMIRESSGVPAADDAAAAVEETPAAAIRESPLESARARLARRLEEYEASLWSELDAGKLREKSAVRAQLRVARRFVELAASVEEPAILEDETRAIAEYEARIERGDYPKSDRVFLPAVLRKLCAT